MESLTDYREFERLCSDLMAGSGYAQIEPIGGTGDRGRDAIYSSKENGRCAIFAYTVRSDWLVKLKHDCKRIQEEEHNPNQVVFVCTSSLSGTDKDTAKQKIRDKFGWQLEIYDIERIRVLLVNELRHLIAQHPAIFCPPWFPTKGGLSIAENKDIIVIDHLSGDHSLATWLSRRLSVAGYKTWCYGLSPLVGENKDESISILINQRAIQYIPILSYETFTDMDFLGRIGSAVRADDFVLPCWSEKIEEAKINAKILNIEPARFDLAWSKGLEKILNQLQARGITPDVDKERWKSIALKAYMPEPITKPIPEKVYSNVFFAKVPPSVLVFDLERKMTDNELEVFRSNWAFVKVSPEKLLSFTHPPAILPLRFPSRIPEYSWRDFDFKEGRNSETVVKELIRRSLDVACVQAGLSLCPDRNVYYFTEQNNKQRNISFIHVDGRRTRVAVTGMAQDGSGERAIKFRYQLSPKFRVSRDEAGEFWVMTRLYIRVVDLDGNPFKGKAIIRKRKKVSKKWWNKEWLARTLGVMQGLANTEENEFIEIGAEDTRKVVITTAPLHWECPISIDVEAVDRIGDFQEEMASARYIEDDRQSDEETNYE